jgi:hypothetical protein
MYVFGWLACAVVSARRCNVRHPSAPNTSELAAPVRERLFSSLRRGDTCDDEVVVNGAEPGAGRR